MVVRCAAVTLAVGTWMAAVRNAPAAPSWAPGPRAPGPRLSATQTPNCQFFSKVAIEVRNYKERDVVTASTHCEQSLCDGRAMEYIIIFYLYSLQFGYNSWYVFEYLVVQKHCIYSFTH